jgi:hypothetical protein
VTGRHHLKVFLSSPSDVLDAREEAVRQVGLLNRDPAIAATYHLDILDWKDAPPVVGPEPQEVINRYEGPAGEADILICIVGRRLGTELTVAGNPHRSGTYYEFLDAYAAYRRNRMGKPIILLYRIHKDAPPLESPEDVRQAEEAD